MTIKINTRKNVEYRMQLAIVQNPHIKDPKILWRILEQNEIKKTDDKLDVVGFELFKQTLSKSSRVNVK